MSPPETSHTAQIITLALFALAFAGLFITAGINVWRGLRRPIIEDQDQAEWLSSVPPWPLARHGSDAITSAGAGSGDGLADSLSSVLHGEGSNL